MDAVLGAAALGDIGQHFPDTAEEYAGADSLMLARRVAEIMTEQEVYKRQRICTSKGMPSWPMTVVWRLW